MREFADREGFAIRIAPTDPSGDHLTIQLWRDDVKLIGVNPFNPEDFRISFYSNCGAALPAGALAELTQSLQQTLSRYPVATDVR